MKEVSVSVNAKLLVVVRLNSLGLLQVLADSFFYLLYEQSVFITNYVHRWDFTCSVLGFSDHLLFRSSFSSLTVLLSQYCQIIITEPKLMYGVQFPHSANEIR